MYESPLKNREHKAVIGDMYRKLRGVADKLEKSSTPELVAILYPKLYEAIDSIENLKKQCPWTYRDAHIPETPFKEHHRS